MAIMRCATLASSILFTEVKASSSCSSFQRASARVCYPSVLSASNSSPLLGPLFKADEQLRSSFLPNNSFKSYLVLAKKSSGILIQAQHVKFKAIKKVTIPFKEGALPANEYLKETERIVKVTFPDSSRIEYMGDKTWRARLRPVTFISITATPIVEMSMRATPRSAETTTVRHDWDFAGSVSLGLTTKLPAAFALIPEGILTRVGDEILDRIIGAMEGALLQGIIGDYNIWCRLKSRKKAANPRQPVVPVTASTNS